MARTSDVRAFDRFARWYDLSMPSADDDALRSALRLAERPVERGLDCCGGTGRAARAFPDVEWTVVDASGGMLERARRRGLAAVRADAARLPVRDESVDAVLVVDALHHVGDQSGVVREAARALRPGGVLAVADFDPDTLRGRAVATFEHLIGFESAFLRPTDLADEFRAAGLSTLIPESGFGYVVAGVKPPER